MLQQHRASIDLCCNTLAKKVNMVRLWPKLLKYRIFNPDDVNIPRWQESLSDVNTIKEIVTTIKTRGPLAFDYLLRSLTEINQANLAEILSASIVDTASNNNTNNVHKISQNLPQNVTTQCAPSDKAPSNGRQDLNYEDNLFDDLVLGEAPVVVKVKKSTEFLDEIDNHILGRYPMRSNPRGLVLLITLMDYQKNKKVRHAAEHDHHNLTQLFEQMGFEVIAKTNLSASEITREVFEFSQKPEHRKMDSCFVIISGHGNRSPTGQTVILGIDDTGHEHPDHQIASFDIINYFSAENCPALSRKPKIFIFQICRGDSTQFAVMDRGVHSVRYNQNLDLSNQDAPRDGTSRNFEHILIVNSTLPGYVSFRDESCGSWFIQILCQVFMNMACSLHIRDLFDKIDELISTKRAGYYKCQTTTVKGIGFNKHLYINPGLFPEDS
ncbi:caspase Dronc isoform X2 [Diachasma alloeum]|uniref:caspase Dronc isoform X2 n=1 Tax=Diachasma alloeum TaxID=454923 RepID=UPI000738439C|nr:caspase Dronc isoform X2 [Diachasma alloeum]